MNKVFFALVLLIFVTNAKGQSVVQKDDRNKTKAPILAKFDFSKLKPIELTRSDSGMFIFEQVVKRIIENCSLQLTPKYFGWKNPTTGGVGSPKNSTF